MAGDWIKMRSDLFTHPKVFALAEDLGRDELWVVGALFAFWSWADKHCVDGRVDGATSRLVDRATRVEGLSAAMAKVGWLLIDDKGIQIPEFSEHNGDSAKERSLKNQRQARWRERKAAGVVDDEASTAPSTAPSTQASTREEKRREENKSKSIGATPKPKKIPLPADFAVSERVRKWAGGKGFDHLDDHLEVFRGKASAKGYVYADWDSAFMEAVREDWAELRIPKAGEGRKRVDL